MKEIEKNKQAWSLLAAEHYEKFKQALHNDVNLLNDIIVNELGDIRGKSVIHLQCNTGADTICLARMGARVTGVDLVPENIHYATKLAADFKQENISFFESDIMCLMENHGTKYDIVFTSEGAIGWLPDLRKWGATISHLLKDDGFFYTMDSHPFVLAFDEEKLMRNELSIRYPYFGKSPDEDEYIGGYASEPKQGTNYFWMYTVSDIINSLTAAGLCIEFFNEYDKLFYKLGDMEPVEKGFYRNPFFKDKIPFTFSLKATVRFC